MQYGYGTLGIIVHPFAGVFCPEFILMFDNDQLQRAERVERFLGREKGQCMDWLARPPDMNPIEDVCDCLQRRIIAASKVWNVSW